MLYFAHMFKVKQSPEIHTLKNRFIFMSDDDSFFMKLYYNSANIIYDIVEKKIIRMFNKEFNCTPPRMNSSIKDKLIELCGGGILISKQSGTSMCLEIRSVNEVDDMDLLYNAAEELKNRSSALHILRCCNGEWHIDQSNPKNFCI